jgi:hypothetical protein
MEAKMIQPGFANVPQGYDVADLRMHVLQCLRLKYYDPDAATTLGCLERVRAVALASPDDLVSAGRGVSQYVTRGGTLHAQNLLELSAGGCTIRVAFVPDENPVPE